MTSSGDGSSNPEGLLNLDPVPTTVPAASPAPPVGGTPPTSSDPATAGAPTSNVPLAPAVGAGSQSPLGGRGVAARNAGLSSLKGLVVYGSTLTFAGFYAYFMEQIAVASSGKAPGLSGAMVAAAAALAGILGSAFALVIGVPTT